MRTLFKNYKIVSGGKISSGDVAVCDGKIAEPVCGVPYDCVYDGEGELYLCPGFIETHVHGGGGQSFMTADTDGIARACDYHLVHGVTSVFPTLSSAPVADIDCALRRIVTAQNQNKTKACIIGAHIEGPYFAPEQCGAQNCDYITPPVRRDYEALYEKFGSLIKRWDYAPERDENYAFTRFLVRHGIVASCGHSNATYEQFYGAYEQGCKLITHLYSGCSTVTRVGGFRRLGVVESAFLLDDVCVELIADGKHLPCELIKMICNVKSESRVILISDALACAGCKNGDTVIIDGEKRIVEDGVVKLPDRTAFAGSIASGDELLRTAVCAGVALPTAVKYLTENPASLYGLNKGKIANGYDADLVVLDKNLYIKTVTVAGQTATVETGGNI